ncbi:MAG: amidohydrolase family protein [Planctomycetaceae bacterium]|nr:amidohydrolase [Planctomycetota bacterium]NUN53777.1 amidohydrolase family protein [Planctomycetaceae bacterium]
MATTAPARPVIDAHAHLLGLDREGSGCVVSRAMRRRISTRFVLGRIGASPGDPPADVDRRYLDHLFANLDASPSVDRVVLLALDGVVGPDGRIDEDRTHLLVPNDLVFRVAAMHPKLLPACSVNPLRADAVAELDRCAARGAVLVKWIPASMGFDPADPRCAPFLARCAALGMPVLSHVGTEMAVTTVRAADGVLGSLFPALEAGVRVVVPHAGSLKFLGDAKDWAGLLEAMGRFPGLWLDDSALLMAHRRRRLRRLLAAEGIHDRVIHGSDFPLPAQPLAFVDLVGFRRARAISRIPGAFEKDVALKEALGVPSSFLRNGDRILRLSPPRSTRP